jgi:glycosyltransferase involved in cell wall biosynthesis
MMQNHVLIAAPLFPPDVGGPSHYTKALIEELEATDHITEKVVFSHYRFLPSVIRHITYLFALLRRGRGASFILGFDVFSVGLPVIIASFLLRKPGILRVSGDFLWERSSEQGDPIPFKEFYKRRERWGKSEKIFFRIIGFTLRHASGLIFQNEWQRNILTEVYKLDHVPYAIIRNNFPGVTPFPKPERKNFLWAGRDMKLKNLARLKEAFLKAKLANASIDLDIITSLPQAELFARIQSSYAVINPSLSEMNPNIVLEGVRFGKPFICTRETGVGEVLRGAGIFVDPEDVGAITEAILDLAKDQTYSVYQKYIAALDITHTYKDIAREILLFAKKLGA